MAVDDNPIEDSSFAESYNSFYPLTIPVSHWQLRHYISHPQPNVLYYASGRDIFYLNTATKKQKHIAMIPFEARCTASGYGYVCVGGANQGHFAAIKLDHTTATPVDAPLPLVDYVQRQQPQHSRNDNNGDEPAPRAASIRVTTIGDQIINSISIHQIHDQEAHLYDLVVVLTNNDNTVRLYSLLHSREMNRLDMPFAMNHASLSPDGRTLAAVGDSNCVFLFDRLILDHPPQIPKPHNRLCMSSVSWQRLAALDLYVPDPTDAAHRGYFTTAWSPSGHLLAVGSEAGYISVIDMQLLRELRTEDVASHAIVGVVRSSRKHNPAYMCPSAVRCMAFSPDPWDLLIWAEDRGRVCIADLRTGLQTRQVIELDTKKADLERYEVELIESDDEMLPELESAAENELSGLENAVADANDAVSRAISTHSLTGYRAAQRRTQESTSNGNGNGNSLRTNFPNASTTRLRGDDDTLFHDDPRGLTAHEQQVLEMLRTSRQRQESRIQNGNGNGNGNMDASTPINYVESSNASSYRTEYSRRRLGETNNNASSTTLAGDDSFPALSRVRAASNTGPEESMEGSRGRLWASSTRQQQQQQQQPTWRSARRRASLVIDGMDQRESSSSDETGGEDDSAWQRISNAMSIARGPTSNAPNGTTNNNNNTGSNNTDFDPARSSESTSAELQTAEERLALLSQQRERLRQLQSSLESSERDSTDRTATLAGRYELLQEATSAIRGMHDMYMSGRTRGAPMAGTASSGAGRSAPRREYGIRTAGLAVSESGRTVWAATEEGIFEIQLALKKRMLWSAIDLS